MYRKKKVSGKAMSMPAGLGVGLLISLLITICGAAITAWLITSEKIGEGSSGYAVMTILILAAGIGALCAVSFIKKQRLQVCTLAGVLYYLSLLAMNALFFDGQYKGMGVSAIIILAGCAVVAFLPAKSGLIKKKRNNVYR